MTVKITKPEINVREELNDLKKPTGVAGEAMLRAETTQEQQALIGVGRRNLLINGNFLIWQRGTSITDSGDGPYNYITADNWVTYYKGTYAQVEEALPIGARVKTMRYTVGDTGNGPNFNSPIEGGANLMEGQLVTMSWWMKASKTGTTMRARVNNVGNGRYASTQYVLSNDISYHEVTTDWTYHSATKVIKRDLTLDHMNFEVWADNAEWDHNDTFQLANCQLEIGNVATPFEHRSYGEELALCHRYYYRTAPANTYSWVAWGGYSNTTTNCIVFLQFPERMRAVPTLGYGGNFQVADGHSVYSCTGPSLADPTQENARIDWTSSGLTVGRVAAVRNANDASAYLEFKAEV